MHAKAVKHAGLSHSKIAYVYHFLNLTLGLSPNLAHFKAHQSPQLFLACSHCIADFPDDISTPRRWNQAPFSEGFFGPDNHFFIISP
jgi:hypothetical protein